MLELDTAAKDSTVVLDGYPYETPRSPWRVVEVRPLADYRLSVTFRDGLRGFVSLKELVGRSDVGVFSALSDPDVFADVSVVFGAVTWSNGLDLAPDAMHEEIRRHGEWIVR